MLLHSLKAGLSLAKHRFLRRKVMHSLVSELGKFALELVCGTECSSRSHVPGMW